MAASRIKTLVSYKYNISLTYLHTKNNIGVQLKNECLKSLIIDYNCDFSGVPGAPKTACMPVMYATLSLDRAMLDDMIKNQNTNLIIVSISKFDKNSDQSYETECIRKKCIYFLPDNVNRTDPIDYNEATEEQMKGDTYQSTILGLMVLEHVENNKVPCELTAQNTTSYDIVKQITSHFADIIIEPFSYNETYKQFILPPRDSVKQALEFLYNHRVFYSTPYRYFQDFNHAYIMSSSGNAIRRPDELYSSITIIIKDIDDVAVNDTGFVINRETGTYEIYLNYANTQVYDNTIVNKSRTKIRGITSTDSTSVDLSNTADYSTADKYSTFRLGNDNVHLLENIQAARDMENFFLYFSKNDLDMDLFTINKSISINNISRYREYNGRYMMYRKREVFIREDTSFVLSSMVNLKRIDTKV